MENAHGAPEVGDLTHYDIHDLLSVGIQSPRSKLGDVLDRTLNPFRADGEDADITLKIGSYPSDDWQPTGATVGDRLLYDAKMRQTSVFRRSIGVQPKKDEVEYAITGEVKEGTQPVEVCVPTFPPAEKRFRRLLRELANHGWRRSLLALTGSPLFEQERLEQQAERILLAILEPFLYYRLPFKGCSLVHASALSSEGSGLLVVGSARVGKTTLALQLVKRGFLYYGDDLAILAKNGGLLSYPKPVKLQSQHLEAFPELARKLPPNEPLDLQPRRTLGEIFEGAKIGDACPLRTVVLIRRGVGNDFSVKEVDSNDLVRVLGAELFWEFAAAPWRHSQYVYCSSASLGNDFIAEEALHHTRIIEVLKSGVRNAKIFGIDAPLSYSPSDLERAVVKVLS
ncbi:MAG: hypothetical protein OK452_02830 [Thaumarchaeota archaeon]|nr:hypothetical protein [Nitrososphaerota archaeon]